MDGLRPGRRPAGRGHGRRRAPPAGPPADATRCGPFRAAQALAAHERSRAWLVHELARDRTTPTVVVTHHAPHPGSIHPRFAGSPVNGAFISDLAELVEQADLWLHGHVHDCFDYQVGRCRVVTNPRGYALNRREAASLDELRFENPGFDGDRLIELPAPERGVGA